MKSHQIFKTIAGLASISLITAIAGCSGIHSMEKKLASLEMKKKTLASGKSVFIDYNLTPTTAWQCRTVGDTQAYNWQELRMQASFSLRGPGEMLMNKALRYANSQRLNANYINLVIPEDDTTTHQTGRLSIKTHLNPGAMATTSFYHCKHINPNQKIGVHTSTDVTFSNSPID